ncbi:MAG: 16S rRNA (cytosine(1402)-N(4))-methyltransferase RsmH [Planctomycetales bacterium]|nr:16S rRNA (cytosine(1402)-N(4))-methyltransferase RsmH [Planctomycetales bacterium]
MSSSVHIPVLLNEVLEQLSPLAGKIIVDGTLGGGGHTRELAKAVGETGLVLAVDRDEEAVERAASNSDLSGLPIKVAQSSYADVGEVLDELSIAAVDGILLDLGLSSDQLEDDTRGFSFSVDGPLDLRFNPDEGEPAWRLLEYMRQDTLADLIYKYGEERYSRRIARKIVEARKQNPIRTSRQLAELVKRCVPSDKRQQIHPATRTMQALRIAVNQELDILDRALVKLPDRLKHSGKFAIISFHSLEDRPVKNAFRDDERLEVITRRPICPSEQEVQANPRSRSAKLRVAERKPL